MFCKRTLAAQLIDILSRPKLKKEVLDTDSENGVDNESLSNDSPADRKNQMD